MAAERNQRAVYASAGWEIDLARRELRSRGAHVPLGSRAFEIIAELVQADGELLSKDELTRRVWRGVHVDEGALRVHMVAIRKAFGPDRNLLNNTAGRGYRLLGAWNVRQVDVPVHATASDPMQSRPDLDVDARCRIRVDRPFCRDCTFA